MPSESDSESRLVLVTRMAMYTRSIDSNLERGRYISRVGRASSFLSLPESTSLYCGTSLYHGTYGTYGTVGTTVPALYLPTAEGCVAESMQTIPQ